jgi:hypothetical protein
MVVTLGGLHGYHVRGFNRRKLGDLNVVLKLMGPVGEGQTPFFLSKVDLARSRSRQEFVAHAVEALGWPHEELARDMQVLITGLENLSREHLKQASQGAGGSRPAWQWVAGERAATEAHLRDQDPLEGDLVSDLQTLGFIASPWQCLVLYLAATSRLLSKPLSVLSIGNASGGKSAGQEAIAQLLPPDEMLSFTRLSPKSLSYHGEDALKNKVVFLDEISAGADRVGLSQLKSLLSRGYLTTSVVSVDRINRGMSTVQRITRGPISIFTAGTSDSLVDDELKSRFLVLPVDESREQTARVIAQAAAWDGGKAAEARREAIRRRYRAIQKSLKPLRVVIPPEWRPNLTFCTERLTYRRKYHAYLSLIQVIALHRQHAPGRIRQGADGEPEVWVARDDILLANELISRLLDVQDDELNPVARRVFTAIESHCQHEGDRRGVPATDVEFSRRLVRDMSQMDHLPARRAVESLLELEYLVVVRGGIRSRHHYRMASHVSRQGGALPLWSPPDDEPEMAQGLG